MDLDKAKAYVEESRRREDRILLSGATPQQMADFYGELSRQAMAKAWEVLDEKNDDGGTGNGIR